jgi:hypothetical protein
MKARYAELFKFLLLTTTTNFCRYKVPDHVNPAEYFADLISIDYSSPEREDITREKLASLVKAFASKEIDIAASITADEIDADNSKALIEASPSPKIGWWKQFRFLLKRAWLQVMSSL